ncbi:MAG: nitrilase-related carbon-nitrogen hydrolase [Polyangiales bacterium]
MRKPPSFGWLALGILLVTLGELRFGIGPLAILAPIPFLVFARRSTAKRAAWVLPAYVLGWTLATAKICTAPLPLVAALGYGIPLGLGRALAVLVHRALAPRLPERVAFLPFPVALVLLDFVQHAATPFASWAAGAYAVLESLPLQQLVAFTGLEGLSFLLYVLTALAAELLLATDREAAWKRLAVGALAIAVVACLGEVRLSLTAEHTGPTVRVAAIDTLATFGGLPLPTDAEVERVDAALAERTRRAAAAGAELVVWTEASSLVVREREPSFQSFVAGLARETHAYVVAGYILPTSLEPLHYENVYVVASPEGRIVQRQAKRQPVPGEPADRGAPAPAVVRTPFGALAGAICYDYDFPRLALDHGERGVDLVALPSSDWRGIDPIHTRMAAYRAIENGHSIVRAARFGLHGIVDPYGRMRAMHSAFEPGDGILLAEVPRHGVRTWHSVLGDSGMVVFLGLFLALVARALARRETASP